MTHRPLIDTLKPMVAEALERIATEDVDYDVAMAVMPGPKGPQPIIAFTMVIKAAVPDQNHSGCLVIQPAIPTQEAVDDLVRQMVNGLTEARAQALRDAMVQANGQGHGPTGPSLIIP